MLHVLNANRIGAGTYSLAQGAALANGDLVTLLNTEGGGDVGSKVLVALLVARVLGDEVQVLSSDDDGSVHLGGDDGAGEDTTADRDEPGEGALLVCRQVSMPCSCMMKYSMQCHCFRSSANPPGPFAWLSFARRALGHSSLDSAYVGRSHVPM